MRRYAMVPHKTYIKLCLPFISTQMKAKAIQNHTTHIRITIIKGIKSNYSYAIGQSKLSFTRMGKQWQFLKKSHLLHLHACTNHVSTNYFLGVL